MDFLDRIYFDNTVRAWLIVSGIITLALLFKRYLSHYLASLFFRLIKKVWKTIRRESFTNLVVEPFKWFLVILIAVFAIDNLNFPQALFYTLYGYTTADILARLGTGIIIVSFIWLTVSLVDFIAVVVEERANLTPDARDNQLVVFSTGLYKGNYWHYRDPANHKGMLQSAFG